jgi:hypothetical protein
MSEQSNREKGRSDRGRHTLQTTIAGLRLCNAAQNDLISNFEDYQRKVLGVGFEDEPASAGHHNGYTAEIGYLRARRQAVDTLIAAVERYTVVAEGLATPAEEEEAEVAKATFAG